MNIRAILDKIQGKRVLVIGDLMLDEWLYGAMERISPEAPCPVVRIVGKERNLGGAANVAANVASLGGVPIVCGIVGDDAAGREIRVWLDALTNGEVRHNIIWQSDRATTRKVRVLAGGQHVVRIDEEERRAALEDFGHGVISEMCLQSVDAVLLSDYDKGVFEKARWVLALMKEARGRGIPVCANPKPRNAFLFEGADFLSLNEREAHEVVGELESPTEDGAELPMLIADHLKARVVAVTRGARGIALAVGEWRGEFPAWNVSALDVAGAGDTFIAAATLCVAAKIEMAAEFANLCAATAVTRKGVVAVTAEDVLSLARNTT